MRFIHIADVHLGAVPDKGYPWSARREKEIWQTFAKVIQAARQEQVDLLLIAGDLFHRQPLLRELKEVNYLFGKLERTQVLWMAGNHDYLQEHSPVNEFAWADNVIFLNGRECERVYFRRLQTSVYGFSYYQREITEPLYDDLVPEEVAGCHILLAHGGDAQHIPIDQKKLSGSGFDYIALGHIHKPQTLIPDRMAYAGALEPIDSNDTGEHGYILGEYRDGRMRTEFVPFACREYVHLSLESTGGMTDFAMREQIARAIAQYGQQHIYKITLTGLRDAQIHFQTEDYAELGNILEVRDQTEPDYNFEELYRQHQNDVVGRYIGKLLPDGAEEEAAPIRKKALYYGLRALHL